MASKHHTNILARTTKSSANYSRTRRRQSICNSTRSSLAATGTSCPHGSAWRVYSGGPMRRSTFGVTSLAGSCSWPWAGRITCTCGITAHRRTRLSQPSSSCASRSAWSCPPCTTRSPVAQRRPMIASCPWTSSESHYRSLPSTSVASTTPFGARM